MVSPPSQRSKTITTDICQGFVAWACYVEFSIACRLLRLTRSDSQDGMLCSLNSTAIIDLRVYRNFNMCPNATPYGKHPLTIYKQVQVSEALMRIICSTRQLDKLVYILYSSTCATVLLQHTSG